MPNVTELKKGKINTDITEIQKTIITMKNCTQTNWRILNIWTDFCIHMNYKT